MAILSASPNALINAVAEELKKNPAVKAPEWVLSVKTGADKDRLPDQQDFWFVRCASLLRTIYLNPRVGVQKLRHKYGGRKRHLVSAPHHRKAGGKIIRLALQQLEAAGLVKKEKAGRIVTDAGKSLLEKLSK